MSKTYTVRVSRDEDAWLVEVPKVARVTQALDLQQVDDMARDLFAIMDDVDPSSIDLRIEWPADIAAQQLVDEARQSSAESPDLR
ncbi:hypothetical protein [Nocardia sp. NPDC057227]|uniref:hypothetical protein n=1 Tax=Nocardia sp. NPDC057227 TaxID=3346056 RepID=UPI003638F955